MDTPTVKRDGLVGPALSYSINFTDRGRWRRVGKKEAEEGGGAGIIWFGSSVNFGNRLSPRHSLVDGTVSTLV